MPTNNERSVNERLGNLIRARVPKWRNSIAVEQQNVIVDAPHQSPDLLIYGSTSPVAIETEFFPANTVEADAENRLGQVSTELIKPIEHVIACRYQRHLREVEQSTLEDELEKSTFGFRILSKNKNQELITWPENDYCEGTIDDLVDCLESVGVSDSLLTQCTDILENGIRAIESELESNSDEIANVLFQEAGKQTDRMAVAIVANAMLFHLSLDGTPGVRSIRDLVDEQNIILNNELRECWTDIIDRVNYWPIFRLASRVLAAIYPVQANSLVNHLFDVVSRLAQHGAQSMNDLSGRIFQRLIVDRKFLATFYTLPVSATLLAELIAERMNVEWQNLEDVKSLRVADWACGTGTLIGAMYQSMQCRVRKFHDDEKLHAHMIEHVLLAFDIMPVATHLAASTLASAHPGIPFNQTNIVTMPYGDTEGFDEPQLGSLELLYDESFRPLFSLGRSVLRGNPGTDKPELVGDESVDVIIMNPPFTRPTNHERTSIEDDFPVPSFAGAGNSSDDQKAMSKRLKRVLSRMKHSNERASNGNAGIATNFLDLAHTKLAKGGSLGLILPFTFVQGESWHRARSLLAKWYCDVVVVSIATEGNIDSSFSADTGMAEVLIIATKCNECTNCDKSVRYVNLSARPKHQIEAVVLARQISNAKPVLGGSDMKMDSLHCGRVAGVRNVTSLHRTLDALPHGSLELRHGKNTLLPMVKLGDLGYRGLLARDITGSATTNESQPRGPFDVVQLNLTNGYPDYPTIWGHNAARERKLVIQPDSKCVPKQGSSTQAGKLWEEYATRLHLNVDFRVNSQPLVAAITEYKTIGGQAWPNFVLSDPKWEIPCSLWLNSTLGVMLFWWLGTRQQLGRTRFSLSRHPQLPVLDPRQLTLQQLGAINDLYLALLEMEFLPANEAYRDETRQFLDAKLLVDVLGLPSSVLEDLNYLRKQWCVEPSVHGGKSTRLQDPAVTGLN